MTTRLFQPDKYPDEIAVSKIESFVSDGLFFLDFSRPIEISRWFGVRNRWLGFAVGLLVPVVHQGEQHGGYVIAIHRDDPYFANILAYWKVHYPDKRTRPIIVADGIKVIADFATQFPDDV